MLTITPHCHTGRTRLVLDGELDLTTAPTLKDAVVGVAGAAAVELDCHRLSFCDSSGVAALIKAQGLATQAGGTLRLINVDGLVRHVLNVCGVLTHLTHHGADPEDPASAAGTTAARDFQP